MPRATVSTWLTLRAVPPPSTRRYLLPSNRCGGGGRRADHRRPRALFRMLGGVLLLMALSTLLAGTALPSAVPDIIFGLVVLSALLALRERSA